MREVTKTLRQRAEEIREARIDTVSYLVDMEMNSNLELVFPLNTDPRHCHRLSLSEYAFGQLAERLGLPRTFVKDLRNLGNDITCRVVNAKLRAAGPLDRMTIRAIMRPLERDEVADCMDENVPEGQEATALQVRAIMSSKYRFIDHEAVLEAAIKTLLQAGDVAEHLSFISPTLNDEHMSLKAVFMNTKTEVVVGDDLYAGVILRNSEIGDGAVYVKPYVWRAVCNNGMVVPIALGDNVRLTHIGPEKRVGRVLERAYSKDAAPAIEEISKAIELALEAEYFSDLIKSLQALAAVQPKCDHQDALDKIADRLNMTGLEADKAFARWTVGGDFSLYGLVNALTACAHDVGAEAASNRFEELGGLLASLPLDEVETLVGFREIRS